MRIEIKEKFEEYSKKKMLEKYVCFDKSMIRNKRNTKGSEIEQSHGVHASDNKNINSETEHFLLLRPSEMRELRQPKKPVSQRELDLDDTVLSSPCRFC